MRILLTGSSGLIGQAALRELTAAGHIVVCLVRSRSNAVGRHIMWDPENGSIDPDDLENFDAVVHLSGETIVGRWSKAKKVRILESRVRSTLLLCDTLAHLHSRPLVLVAASAVGYYGDRGDQKLDEESSAGSLFVSEVAKAWEAATESASQHGIRVVNLRMGFVLSKSGGGLTRMLLPFRLGLGGRVGNGRQFVSWVTVDDVVGAISHAISADSSRGPMNVVAPQPVTNREFTRALGGALWRPTLFPLPAFAARMMFGEMADDLLLSSQRVEPKRLIDAGYEFKFPKLEPALRHVLGE
jgi:uncharacterized protein